MKNLLNYLPSWKTTKLFLNIIYHVGFVFWFLSRIILMILKPFNNEIISVIKTDDIFIALIFLIFFVLEIKETLLNKENK
jgi:hypothetical protein